MVEERRCQCWCHAPIDGIWFPHGVSVLDVIEAAVACSCCRPRHAPALLSRRLANSPEPRERTLWVDPDPIRPQADGDGDPD